MNIKELGEYLALKKEIELKKEELEGVRCDVLSCIDTTQCIATRKGVSRQERRLMQLEKLGDELMRSIEKSQSRRREIEKYISVIPDSRTRSVFMLRFLRGMSWKRIAMYMGGGNTEATVKMLCYRYIQNH